MGSQDIAIIIEQLSRLESKIDKLQDAAKSNSEKTASNEASVGMLKGAVSILFTMILGVITMFVTRVIK